MDDAGTNLDPFRAWKVMMSGEKPGGHGERCVAVGALDMALWDATAKIAQLPLYRLLADRTAGTEVTSPPVSVYAGGGYYYPTDDVGRLSDEVRCFSDLEVRVAACTRIFRNAGTDGTRRRGSGDLCQEPVTFPSAKHSRRSII
jgi:L-alanine-DL-glutamate epimerase-like enolase superfamily enzyme